MHKEYQDLADEYHRFDSRDDREELEDGDTEYDHMIERELEDSDE